MRTRIRHFSLFILLLILFPGAACSQSDPPKDRKPVAVVGGQTIYEDELLQQVQKDLLKLRNEEYELKYSALQNLILRRLLNEEARKRNITVDQLILQEADGKAAEPTDEEVQAQYQQQRDSRKFEDVKEQYRRSLKQSRVRDARQAYFRRVLDAAAVNILLEPPRVEVRHDPSRVRGNPSAPVMIVEFSDFQCPYCRRVNPTLLAVLEKYKGQVALAFRDYPLREIHPGAQLAAEASRCAGEQGKFWEYHDKLFGPAPAFDRPSFSRYAQEIGIDAKRFESCVDSGKFRASIEEDYQAGQRAGVNGTPGFFINGVFLDGAVPVEEFSRVIDAELAALKRKK